MTIDPNSFKADKSKTMTHLLSVGDKQKSLREHAVHLHQTGNLADAQQLYQRLIEENPKDADILGLLALSYYQAQKKSEALDLWIRANKTETESRIAWRNVQNLFTAAAQSQSPDYVEAARHTALPNWNLSDELSVTDIHLARSVAEVSKSLGRDDLIDFILRQIINNIPINLAETQDFLRWIIDKRPSTQNAKLICDRLELSESRGPDLLLLIGACRFMLNDADRSSAIARHIAENYQSIFLPTRNQHILTVAILNQPPTIISNAMSLIDFHLRANTPRSLVQEFHETFRFISIFPKAVDTADVKLASPDIIINNWVNAESMSRSGTLEVISNALDKLSIPIINKPEHVAMTTRQRNSLNLQDIPNVKVPKIIRFQRSAERIDDLSLAKKIADEIDFPIILRDPFRQLGMGATKFPT